MENQVRPVEVTPKDIAMALDGISDWVRSVRSAVLMMDPTGTVTIQPPTLDMMAPPSVDDGCPPPRKKKKKNTRKPKKAVKGGKKRRSH